MLWTALAGCGSAPPPEPAGAPPSSAPAPAGDAAPGAQPAPGASAQGQPAPGASAQAAPVSPFIPVARAPFDEVRLLPIEGAMLLAGGVNMQDEADGWWGYPLGVLLPDGTIEVQKSLRLPSGLRQVAGVVGRWPDAIDVIATGDTGRTGIAELWTLGPRGWQQRHEKHGNSFVGLAKIGASVVALQAPVMAPFHESQFVAVRGPNPGLKLTPSVKKECSIEGFDHPIQRTAVLPSAVASTGDGKVLSYGRSCAGDPSLELWKPGARTSTILGLELAKRGDHRSASPQVLAGAANDAWIFDGFASRFDGATWKEVEGPNPEAGVADAAVAGDGTLWVLSDGAVFARRGETWERAPLPEGVKAHDLATASDGTLWIAAGGALLRHGKPGERSGAPGGPVVPLDPTAGPAPKPAQRRLVRPGGPACPRNLVVLYTFSKVTPDDHDFPLTRKALKGHTEFAGARFAVTRDGGQKFFTALVPSFDMGQKLAALIRKEVQGSSPNVVCADPEILRELKLDLKSGEVVK
ncbi:WD40/YVTN/BNR-like repeat-containing protein [Sorangium sp. So ce1335]|uniref:WD40/YVTN/BNR-like repeat-containing protein n=1 Tax=Sorangium sp. So ce1335 TaxID=3133335 RepID=UPI003F5FC4F2